MKALFSCTLLMAAVAGWSAAAECAPGEVKVRMSITTAVKGHPKGEAATALAARVNEKLDGRMCMEVHGRAELYDDDTVLEAMLAGDVEMAAPSLSKFEAYTRAFRLFDLPFLFDSPLAALNYQNSEAGQRLRTALDPAGFASLGFWTNGMKQISATKPLRMPEDAKGLRFRVQPSPVIEAQFAALGAETKRLAFPKVHDALESGEVDGQQNTWSNIYTRKFFKHQAGVTESIHAYLGYMVVTSQAFLEGLDPDLRNEFLLLFELTTHEYNRFAYEINQLRAQDVWRETRTIVELSDAEREAWRAAFAPVYAEFAEEIGADRIAEAQSFNAR